MTREMWATNNEVRSINKIHFHQFIEQSVFTMKPGIASSAANTTVCVSYESAAPSGRLGAACCCWSSLCCCASCS